ncbi:diguanylate cyclase [Hyphomicrobium nitrativorans NL23]|uniref:diguanylate cyclase n=1 Tax=Hyphomicrobium nitrativorans NL23 TaxID=1029756 RepID=V5SFC8_9HYPH|nr:GGDEF domain-containing protein [Hyphomicrobium nitrativorans]AHB48664.1 diguanylate cyclase [Hyphomicrobium nitrativorans NL23]
MTVRDLPRPSAATLSLLGHLQAAPAAVVFALVLSACLFGIATRPAGFLAAVWPANALLLGLFVRHPRFATPAGWGAAIAAYVVADLATGATLQKTLLLTSGNLVAVFTGYLLYARLGDDDRRLKRPFSVLYLTLISAAAAGAAGIVGAVVNPILFHGSALEGLLFWTVTEFVNFIVLLPMALTLPAPRWPARHEWREFDVPLLMSKTAPILALIPSCLASHWIGGPGAMAFPAPALLWCALVLSVSGTAVITFLVSSWTLIGISTGAISLGADVTALTSVMSIRIGVALMALAPLNVAAVMAARKDFQFLLQRMVTNDPMTAALTRRAFALRARKRLRQPSSHQTPFALLLFDIDGLRHINAQYGHETGDQALKSLARAARTYLPNGDELGRLGSDDFAILLVDCSREEATALAERIRTVFNEAPIQLPDGHRVRAKASVGIAAISAQPTTAEHLLNIAEDALRQSKRDKGV